MLLSPPRHQQSVTCQDHTPSLVRDLNLGLQRPWPALAAWCVNVERSRMLLKEQADRERMELYVRILLVFNKILLYF